MLRLPFERFFATIVLFVFAFVVYMNDCLGLRFFPAVLCLFFIFLTIILVQLLIVCCFC